MGRFSVNNLLSINLCAFKTFIQAEAAEFLQPSKMLLNWMVRYIEYSTVGVKVMPMDIKKLSADYMLCTFSLSMLQNTIMSQSSLHFWTGSKRQSRAKSWCSISLLPQTSALY